LWRQEEGSLKLMRLSNNLASLHLLAAIFFNPLLGITMHKRDWKLFDFALAVFLCLALTRILKERTRPRYNLVMLNSNGQPAKRSAEMNAYVIDQALKLWPTAVFLCLVTMAFVLNNAKGLWKSQLVLFDLIEATLACFCVSGVCAAILVGILELFWKVTGKIPTQAYLVVFAALFIGFATTPMIQKLVVPVKYSSEDSGERDPSRSKDMQTCCEVPTLGAYSAPPALKSKSPKPLRIRALRVVAGVGFEPQKDDFNLGKI
jgi:hypothetical protein